MAALCARPQYDDLELQRRWQAVLGRLQLEMNVHTFETWLRGTRPRALENGTLIVEARVTSNLEWLNERLGPGIQRATAAVLDDAVSVVFVAPRAPAADRAVPLERAVPHAPPNLPVAGAINSSHTLDTYVRGKGNALALENGVELAAGARAFSPLVLTAPPGMGKTHLLHALARQALEAGRRVACLSAEEFTTRYISALHRREIEAFQSLLRSVDLLAIDDLQYLEGRTGTANELQLTLDAVDSTGGAAMLASEKHPQDLGLPARLVQRLCAGLVAPLGPLGAAERLAFVQRLSGSLAATLPDWADERLAASGGALRVLRGAVHHAVALHRAGQLEPGRLDAELAHLQLGEAPASAGGTDAILAAVAAQFALDVAALRGASRSGPVRDARAITVVALHEQGSTLSEIGRILGRDPTTVKGLLERGRHLVVADSRLGSSLAEIRAFRQQPA